MSAWRSWPGGMANEILNLDERQRVKRALDWSEFGSKMDCVMQMQSANEFHQYVLNYNCNDGALPLFYVVKHSECDLGTALLIYWLHEDILYPEGDEEPIVDAEEHDWNQLKLMKLIEERVASKAFKNKNIRFSPREFLNLTELSFKRKKIQWGDEWPFPKHMIEDSLGENMPRIQF